MRGLPLLGLACLAVQALGCSALGFALGSRLDIREATGPPPRVRAISPGSALVLHLGRRGTVRGVYRGTDDDLDEAYAARYREWRAVHAAAAWGADLGAAVAFVDSSGARAQGSFAGLGCVYAVVRPSGGASPLRVPIDTLLAEFERAPAAPSLDSLRRVVEAAKPPLTTVLLIETADGPRRIAVDDVASVTTSRGRQNRVVLSAMGFALDGAVLAGMGANHRHRLP